VILTRRMQARQAAFRARRCAGSSDCAHERTARCRNRGAAHESLADQRVRRCMRRISTSLPTFSVGKWRGDRAVYRTRIDVAS